MAAIFIHIPKTAGMSLRSWIHENVNSGEEKKILMNGHCTPSEFPNFEKCDWSFAVVRNSYDRMVSYYEYAKRKNTKRMEKAITRGTINETATSMVDATNKGPVYFMEWSVDHPDDFANRAMVSQLKFIEGVDHVLRYENLNEEFKLIQEKLNCFVPITQQKNKMSYDKKNIMDEQFIKCVEKIFSAEIEYFNYIPNKG